MSRLQGYFLVLAATSFWGGSAIIAKVLLNEQTDPLFLVQTRVTFSFLTIFGILLAFKPPLLRIRIGDIPHLALLGVVGMAGSNFTYYYTIQQINVTTAILVQYTAPLLVLAYAALSREETLTFPKIAAAILSVAGCFLAVGGKEFTLAHVGGLGVVSAIGSAVCWAFTNIYIRHLLRHNSVWTVLAYSFLIASLFWLFFNPPWTLAATGYSPDAWLGFAGFALISVLIPHSLYFMGVRRLTASRAIITGTFEPIVAIAGSYIVLGDPLSFVQILGGIVVVGAIALLQIKREAADVPLSPEGAS